MLFNSFEYLLFLPVVFLCYWFVFRRLKWQNLFVVVASYVFYGWWDYRFLLLIATTTLLSYVSGLAIAHYEGARQRQKLITAANIVLNLAILCVFKYYNFFGENFAALLSFFGWKVDWVTLDILLPVGISFYTFQALSYSIDVYQKKLRACRDLIAFVAYISFFPQLVAGPIERATNLLPQFYRSRKFDYAAAVDGCRQILWGFFKKIVVADNCAVAVNMIWADYQNYSGFILLIGGVLFTLQIYGDFSGYSDIAIGTARLFGINLMRNFNYPFFSRNISEFWRRWHISLTTWFRDYIYFPLGGSRCGRWKTMRNTLIVFLVSGFWHGANWTFIAWGAFHACLFFLPGSGGRVRRYTAVVAEGRLLPSLREGLQMLATFGCVVVGFIIFRSESIGQAWNYIARICSPSLFDVSGLTMGRQALLFGGVLLLVEWLQRNKQHALQLTIGSRPARYAIYYAVLLSIVWFATGSTKFIYFQF